MEILYGLQEIRTPVLDFLVQAVTFLGEETVFMVVSIVILWCVDKKWGFRFFFLGMIGNVLNQIMKAAFVTPRPWVRDPNFAIVETAREAATGYSFPSGHTMGAASLLGSVALFFKRRWVTVLCILLALMVGFSRLYLGVHMPEDVIVGLLVSLLLVLAMGWLFKKADDDPRYTRVIVLTGLGLSLLLLLFVLYGPKGGNHMPEFDAHGVEAGWSMFGCIAALALGVFLDEKYIHFETKAVWWAQLIKAAVGIGVILAIRILLKAPLAALFGAGLGKGVRYFLMSIFGVAVWPLTFGWFSRLGRRP